MEMRADFKTVALGYSKFCDLFTKKEWKGYQYRWDLYWYYSASFGYPQARAQGIGYAQELVSRLTHSEHQRRMTLESPTDWGLSAIDGI